ncbi:GNAT family N-acetyltransferase [Natronospora cellulosivora (SeqCode)]
MPPLIQSVEEIRKDYKDQVFLKKIIEDKIAGSVRAYVKDDICYIGRLIVNPDYQNQGIGKELMKNVEEYFSSCCDKYSLFTGKKSEKNIYLYESLGYVQIKKKKLNDKVTLIFLEKINK